MNIDTVQQFIRIVLFSVGAWLFGEGVTSSSAFEGAVGGVISVATFAWWYFWDRTHDHVDKSS